MKDIRKGNDINVKWSIYAEGAPFSLEGKEISLYLRTPYGKKEVTPVVEGNAVLWTFFGKDQKHTGKHSLELVINENAEGMVTTDACDFVNLVDCSCKVGGADDAGVQTESIELTSTLEYVAGSGGGEAYDDTYLRTEVARLEREKADKTELDELSTEIQQVSENKQDKISDLDAIRSGASKGATAIQEVKTINGQSIVGSGNIVIEGGSGGGMTTPSGDPMHYMFEMAGATYNATDADIPKVGMYGDSYVHKAKHWHLNELGDLTTQEMREIYARGYFHSTLTSYFFDRAYVNYKLRTNLMMPHDTINGVALNTVFQSCKCATIVLSPNNNTISFTSATLAFAYSNSIKKILNTIDIKGISIGSTFDYCSSLIEVRLKNLQKDITFNGCNNLSNASILFLIQNESSATPISVKLVAAVYERAMADADIQAALTAHPNVSLAK